MGVHDELMVTEKCHANQLKGDSIARQLILNAEYRCELTPWGISSMRRGVIFFLRRCDNQLTDGL